MDSPESFLIQLMISTINQQIVEGNTSDQIEACRLVKELILERNSISDFSDLKCIFLEQSTTDNFLLLDLELTENHSYHNNYIEQKNYWESAKEEPFLFSPVLVDPDKKLIMDLNSKKAVIKNGDTFREVNQEDIKLLEPKL